MLLLYGSECGPAGLVVNHLYIDLISKITAETFAGRTKLLWVCRVSHTTVITSIYGQHIAHRGLTERETLCIYGKAAAFMLIVTIVLDMTRN